VVLPMSADYAPKVWSWNKDNGGQFASIDRPIAGATHDKELPVGEYPFQLYSLGTLVEMVGPLLRHPNPFRPMRATMIRSADTILLTMR
jgi:hypothetical protein